MTKRKDRHVTIVLHTDGDLASRQYRVPVWAFEAGKWSALLVGLLVVLFFAFAGPIGRAAARVPGLVPPAAGRSRRRVPTWRTDYSCSCDTRAGMKRCMGMPRAFWCEKATRCRRAR